jgi:membrane-associated phospholipid phosphatase
MLLKTRLFYLLIGCLTTCMVYIAAGFVRGSTWIIPETPIDQFIPFNPTGIWLYLFLYVYIPYTFLTVNESKVKRISLVFIITSCISGIIFVFLPSSVIFPDFKIDGMSASLLKFVSENDTEQNCIPSLHASLITICTLANWDKTNKIRSYGCILLTLLMYYSIIEVRRHVFIDLAAGILVAVIVWQSSSLLLTRIRKSEN